MAPISRNGDAGVEQPRHPVAGQHLAARGVPLGRLRARRRPRRPPPPPRSRRAPRGGRRGWRGTPPSPAGACETSTAITRSPAPGALARMLERPLGGALERAVGRRRSGAMLPRAPDRDLVRAVGVAERDPGALGGAQASLARRRHRPGLLLGRGHRAVAEHESPKVSFSTRSQAPASGSVHAGHADRRVAIRARVHAAARDAADAGALRRVVRRRLQAAASPRAAPLPGRAQRGRQGRQRGGERASPHARCSGLA